jgi:hypothetical protein
MWLVIHQECDLRFTLHELWVLAYDVVENFGGTHEFSRKQGVAGCKEERKKSSCFHP